MVLIPVRDNVPSRRLPVVNYLLVVANIFVFVYEISLSADDLRAFTGHFAFTPAHFSTPVGLLLDPLTLFTSMFMHANLAHIAGNLLYLFIFGDNIEDRLGPLRYLLFYAICGIGAAATQYAMNPGSPLPMVGASGAISGVLGAYLVLYPKAKVVNLFWFIIIVKFIELPALLYLGFWFMAQLFGGLNSVDAASTGGVAFWAHIGGFIAGAVLIIVIRPANKSSSRR